ncbi:MAG: flagellar hook-basal body complex protein FliE [Deinococcus-Thermus bacterium]|jgi:flagellar hook-basal body complex protein FliE|nr:flagellar hook-basal body complex protein FliE [Deinococcota bacterium]
MDIRATHAARLYQGAQNAARPDAAAGAGDPGIADGARAAAQDFAETLRAAERTAADAMVGKADPHALVEALSQSELAVEAAVAVRDKVVEAYQEILRMPV